jgi:Uma2 family endonuclease
MSTTWFDRRVTSPDLAPLPNDPDSRLECIGGTLVVSSAPRLAHQLALAELLQRLGTYCSAIGGWFVATAPFDLLLDPYTLVPPDLAVFRMRDGTRYPASITEAGRPALFVEVLPAADRTTKRRRYQRMGVETLLVDLDQRAVERWAPAATLPEVLRDVLCWRPPGAAMPFTLDLQPFFSRFHTA